MSISLRYIVSDLARIDERRSYQVANSGYMYRIEDRLGRELFAYHWHPQGLSRVVQPHLHLSAVAPFVLPLNPRDHESKEIPVEKAHFPTGRVALQQVIRMLIEDFGVEARIANWKDVLGEPEFL